MYFDPSNLNANSAYKYMLRPEFKEFLKVLYNLTGAKLQTIDRYEVGQKMGLDKTQTDNMVNQLSDINMIKKVMDSKIILNL